MSYRIYDADETGDLLPYGALRDELATVLADHAAGRLYLEERIILPLAAGTLLAMPASDDRLSITKVVTVHPGNAERGLPTISGEVIVARADDGLRLGLLHGGTVTMRRTAAVSLVGARALGVEARNAAAAPGSAERRLLLFGAGDQARGHAEAFVEELSIEHVTVASRTVERAAALVEHLRARGVSADLLPQSPRALEDELGRSATIATATTSVSPVLRAGVRPDAAIFAVGAYRADMAELAPELVGSASRVVVDTLAGAKHEAGDLLQAVAAGSWSWDRVETLPDLLSSEAGGGREALAPVATARPPVTAVDGETGHTVFKSVGHAMYDLAAARVAFPAT